MVQFPLMPKSYLESTFSMFLKTDMFKSIPKAQKEWTFYPNRKWRFDFAWPKQMVAVELEGGLFSFGGHSRGAGHIRDMDKFNSAASLGWLVLRFSNQHLRDPKAVFDLLDSCLKIGRRK